MYLAHLLAPAVEGRAPYGLITALPSVARTTVMPADAGLLLFMIFSSCGGAAGGCQQRCLVINCRERNAGLKRSLSCR